MDYVVMLMIRDALRHASGARTDAPYTNLIYCRVPEDWVIADGISPGSELWLKGPQLVPERLEKIFEALYGSSWRSGNVDGSRYEVLAQGTRLLNPAYSNECPWRQDDPNNPTRRCHYYTASSDGAVYSVPASQF